MNTNINKLLKAPCGRELLSVLVIASPKGISTKTADKRAFINYTRINIIPQEKYETSYNRT